MTGIICEMEIELEKILLVTENKEETVISGKKYIKGSICGKNIVASVSGVGKVNAAICAQSMILRFSPNIIINSGVAGGLSDTIATTDIVIADKVVQHDIDMTPVGKNPGYIIGLDTVEIKCDKKITDALCRSVKKLGIHYETGTIASGDQFINGGEKVKYIKTVFNASATEMEDKPPPAPQNEGEQSGQPAPVPQEETLDQVLAEEDPLEPEDLPQD